MVTCITARCPVKCRALIREGSSQDSPPHLVEKCPWATVAPSPQVNPPLVAQDNPEKPLGSAMVPSTLSGTGAVQCSRRKPHALIRGALWHPCYSRGQDSGQAQAPGLGAPKHCRGCWLPAVAQPQWGFKGAQLVGWGSRCRERMADNRPAPRCPPHRWSRQRSGSQGWSKCH